MPGKRQQVREKISWSRDMNIYLLECRDNAKILNGGENCPRKANGRKVGYMELMYDMFLEKFPGVNSLTPQNLRDQVAQAEKCQECQQTPLEDTYRSEIDSMQQIPMEETTRDDDISDSQNTDEDFNELLNEQECKALSKAKELLGVINREHGKMDERR